jgi:protein TonB
MAETRPHVRNWCIGLTALVLLAACSKGEAPIGKPRTAAPSPQVAPASPAPTAEAGQIDAALKERLARQEAAEKMFEKKNEAAVLQPPPPRVPTPPEAAAKASAPAFIPAPAPATAPVAERKPEPAPTLQKVEAPKSEAPKADAPKVAAIAPPPAPAPTPEPKAAPAKAPAQTRLVSRVEPEFPTEALRAGVESGSVRARMTLDATGQVTRVEIVDAKPRRVFDRAVTKALGQWRYSEGDAGRTVESEIAFQR